MAPIDARIEPRDGRRHIEEQIAARALRRHGDSREGGQVRVMLVGPLRGETMECGAFLFQLGEQRLALHDCKDRRRREQQHTADGDQPGRAFEEGLFRVMATSRRTILSYRSE
ncbi:MAG: hypothetical protein JNL14_09470 [Devosia sp.]|nr:hypothetical protein [Devosia sp.]